MGQVEHVPPSPVYEPQDTHITSVPPLFEDSRQVKLSLIFDFMAFYVTKAHTFSFNVDKEA